MWCCNAVSPVKMFAGLFLAVSTITCCISTSVHQQASEYFRVKEEDHHWLEEVRAASCSSLLDAYAQSPVPSKGQLPGGPPRLIPAQHLEEFTMRDVIPVTTFFVDDTIEGKGTHYSYGRQSIESMVGAARAALAKVKAGQKGAQRQMDQWLLEAVLRHPIRGQHVIVFGSMEPWYEAVALAAGATHVTTIEYNTLTYDHPNMTTCTPSEVRLPDGGFDVGFSISSFDHDGLGRYGDVVSPIGDLKAMKIARCMMRPNALLFLTVPVGPDALVWNLHRRYGAARLSLLLDDWRVMDSVGWDEARVIQSVDPRRSYEPVLVCRAGEREESDTSGKRDDKSDKSDDSAAIDKRDGSATRDVSSPLLHNEREL